MSKYIVLGLLGYLVGTKQKDMQKMLNRSRVKKRLMHMMKLA